MVSFFKMSTIPLKSYVNNCRPSTTICISCARFASFSLQCSLVFTNFIWLNKRSPVAVSTGNVKCKDWTPTSPGSAFAPLTAISEPRCYECYNLQSCIIVIQHTSTLLNKWTGLHSAGKVSKAGELETSVLWFIPNSQEVLNILIHLLCLTFLWMASFFQCLSMIIINKLFSVYSSILKWATRGDLSIDNGWCQNNGCSYRRQRLSGFPHILELTHPA